MRLVFLFFGGDDVNSKLRVTVRNNVKMTVCRVGLWSIFTGLGAYLLYPSLQQCLPLGPVGPVGPRLSAPGSACKKCGCSGQNRFGIQVFLVGIGEFTTHLRTYFSGDWDVHSGYGFLTHGHVAADGAPPRPAPPRPAPPFLSAS